MFLGLAYVHPFDGDGVLRLGETLSSPKLESEDGFEPERVVVFSFHSSAEEREITLSRN